MALRRWRKHPFRDFRGPEWRRARNAMDKYPYDAVIDAQGLVKSAVITRLIKAPRIGMDRRSAREPLASAAYDRKISVPRDMHAVERIRLLFSRALNYSLPATKGDYGVSAYLRARGRIGMTSAAGGEPELARPSLPGRDGIAPKLLFFHGTARAEKLWPEDHWVELAELAGADAVQVWLPWGSPEEKARAERIAARAGNATALPRLDLLGLAGKLLEADAAVAVDTGLGHLAAALDVPTVSLYGPTSTSLIGAYGRNQVHLESPLGAADTSDPQAMMSSITAAQVWSQLAPLLCAGNCCRWSQRHSWRQLKMRLAFLLYKYFPYGGMQRDFRRFVEESQQRGHDCRVYYITWQGEPLQGVDLRQVPVSALSNHKRNELYRDWVMADLAKDPVDGLIGFNKMPGLDVYYAADSCYLDKALQERGALYRRSARFRHFSEYEQAVFKADGDTDILLISATEQAKFDRHYHTPAQRMHMLPPGISPDRRRPDDATYRRRAKRDELGLGSQDFVMLFVGSGFIKKGLDRAIAALATVVSEQPSVTARLLVVGQDKQRRFERLAKRLGVADAVVFLGGAGRCAGFIAHGGYPGSPGAG